MKKEYFKTAIAIGGLAALGLACGTEWEPTSAHGAESADFSDLEHGRRVYDQYCVGCHGAEGDGKGASARFMDPKPRDFKACKVKFASVPSGEMPRDEDYFDTLTHGLKGTAMPGFPLLPDCDRRAVVTYIKSFCPKPKAAGQALKFGKNPWARYPAQGIAEGEKVYHAFGRCWNCHPAYAPKAKIAKFLADMDMPLEGGFRPDLYEPVAKDSDWGDPILPPDFIYHRMKTGTTPDRLVRAIGAGIGGTAMPTWVGGLNERQLWGLALYVETLIDIRGTPEARALKKQLAEQPAYVPPAPQEETQETPNE